MVQRVTLRKKNPYHTKRNHIRQVKTPGGKLIVHYQKKIAKGQTCKDTGVRLSGIPCLRPRDFARINKRQRSVSRAYGGMLSHGAVKDRILRAFLTEEFKASKKGTK